MTLWLETLVVAVQPGAVLPVAVAASKPPFVTTEPPGVGVPVGVGVGLGVGVGVGVPPKLMSRMGWSSIPLGATPFWPWISSQKPTPRRCTGTFAVWKLVVAVYLASNAALEFL